MSKVHRGLASIFFLLFTLSGLNAQSLEPRLYSNIPTDLNFLVLGYAYSTGALESSSELQDPQLDIHTSFLAYARGLNIAGYSSKVDIALPSACLDGSAKNSNGETLTRNICGLGDIKSRIAFNLYGAPALSLKKFGSYKQDVIIGTSLQVTVPTGQYDSQKLVNIGTNRWAIKASLGLSKRVNNLLFELSIDGEYFTANNNYILGKKEQSPIYSTQLHLIYTMPKGVWIALDSNYYTGGENTIAGVKKSDGLDNSRTGLTLAFPLSKKYSLKLYGSRGILTRAGTNFDTFGLALQYRFLDSK